MDGQVRLLVKARNISFRSGDTQAYSTARADLKRGIKRGEHSHKLKVGEHFRNSDPRRMWQGLQDFTDITDSGTLTPGACGRACKTLQPLQTSDPLMPPPCP